MLTTETIEKAIEMFVSQRLSATTTEEARNDDHDQ